MLRYRRAHGGPGAARGQFNRPTGVAARGSEVFVADTANHRVQVRLTLTLTLTLALTLTLSPTPTPTLTLTLALPRP